MFFPFNLWLGGQMWLFKDISSANAVAWIMTTQWL